jgi:hypothetical protein
MTDSQITRYRLHHHQITQQTFDDPQRMVAYLGALQAQDYAGAKWSVGLRLPQMTDDGVEQAIADKAIVRTWALRGTLHFVAPADVRWMMTLLSSRVIKKAAGRYRELGLDDKVISKSHAVLTSALQDGKALTREELAAALERKRVSTKGERMGHMLVRAALDQLICLGPRNGKQFTHVLLDEWVPATKPLQQDEALAALALRYFTGHGPALLEDFAWWSGLTMTDAKAARDLVSSQLHAETVNGKTYWMSPSLPAIKKSSKAYFLPAFDEYLLGYTDRSAMVDAAHVKHVVSSSNGLYSSTILLDGRVAGTWKRTVKKDTIAIETTPLIKLDSVQQQAIEAAAKRYGKFIGGMVVME